MYDIIIVGARCAGAALALMLARSGHKVLMVDRAVFPRDTMSGHYIHPAGVSWLKRWGVLDRLAATDTPSQSTMTIDFGPVVLTARPAPAADGTTLGYGPRRWLFDPLLAEAAVEAGAQWWDGTTVTCPIFKNDRVVGIEGKSLSGRRVEARARLVVGADGKRSRIAGAVGAANYLSRPSATCNYYSYWSDFEVSHTHLFARDGRFFVVLPTNKGLTYLGVAWPISEFYAVRSNLEQAFNSALSEIPWIADRLAGASRVERFIGTADLDGYFRTAHGPGWALVGDAGYHRDPITAQGMTDAFLHAELLAQAIGDGFSGIRPLEAALADYQRKRDEATLPMYELTCDMARLAPPAPEMLDLLAALEGNGPAAERFFGIMAGTVAAQDFFSQSNIARIVGKRRAA